MPSHIIVPSQPQLVEEVNKYKATYALEPLNPGYGVTLANSLRRVMLSSLVGSAATYYKINGVDHEFSSIPNVLEDMIDITLNIKALRFTLDQESQVTGHIKTSGQKLVTASDIELPTGVEVVDPETPILTLTDPEATLDMEITIERGVGFKKGEEQDSKSEVGLVAVDSVFTPVTRVSYDVQDMRVGDQTNYNRVLFTVTTDGTISPLQAIEESARILVTQFTALVSEQLTTGEEVISEEDSEEPEPSYELSQIQIDNLEIPQRTKKALVAAEITNLAQLQQMSRDEVAMIKGVSDRALKTLAQEVEKFDFTLD